MRIILDLRVVLWLVLVLGTVLGIVTVHLWMRWQRLERWLYGQVRRHQIFADNTAEGYARIMHLSRAKAYNHTLVAMEEITRARWVGLSVRKRGQ